MKFEWNDQKSEINYKKHRIRFEEAQTVFADPKAIEFFDDVHSNQEDRFIRIGNSLKGNVLLVIFCERLKIKSEGVIRIISARKATTNERRLYEERI